jgi:hypothetical protein
MRAGYLAVSVDIEPDGDLCRLSFKRADGKIIPVSMTADQVLTLATRLRGILVDTPGEESVTDDQ